MSGISAEKYLNYAEAYLVLGLVTEAREEVRRAEAVAGRTLPVLQARLEVSFAANAWDEVLIAAPDVLALAADNERATIAWAYAARELQQVELAREILQRAERWLGATCALLHYNLACYECLLGEVESARRRLAHAVAMDARLADGARDDPDLHALYGPTG